MKRENIFKTIYAVERNGRVFFFHWKYRFDPLTMTAAATVAGTGMSVIGQINQGKQKQQIANANAKVDMMNAQYARDNAIEQAKIQAERGRRLIASQKAGYASSGIKINTGVPLLVEAQTNADIAKDIGFTLEQGEQAYNLNMSSAAINKQVGENARKNSLWGAAATGLQGLGSIAMMGYQGGMWGNGGGKMKFSGANKAKANALALDWMNTN